MDTPKPILTVNTLVNASMEKVWKYWTSPEHIIHWNNASDDWHTPKAENDLRVGGRFVYTMAARDGSFSFDLGGTYDYVDENQFIGYKLDDGRLVSILFEEENGQVAVEESFDPEDENPPELQQSGWQAILDNFKKYVEAN